MARSYAKFIILNKGILLHIEYLLFEYTLRVEELYFEIFHDCNTLLQYIQLVKKSYMYNTYAITQMLYASYIKKKIHAGTINGVRSPKFY